MARKEHGKMADRRARVEAQSAGWEITRQRLGGEGRFVAVKTIIEHEDHSITKRYESDIILTDLAKKIIRRERETA